MNCDAYRRAKTKEEKTSISHSIVKTLREGNPPSRFLQKCETQEGGNEDQEVWEEIGDRKAWQKTSQLLREMVAKGHHRTVYQKRKFDKQVRNKKQLRSTANITSVSPERLNQPIASFDSSLAATALSPSLLTNPMNYDMINPLGNVGYNYQDLSLLNNDPSRLLQQPSLHSSLINPASLPLGRSPLLDNVLSQSLLRERNNYNQILGNTLYPNVGNVRNDLVSTLVAQNQMLMNNLISLRNNVDNQAARERFQGVHTSRAPPRQQPGSFPGIPPVISDEIVVPENKKASTNARNRQNKNMS